MPAVAKPCWAEAVCLAVERSNDTRHETINGEVIAFAGASRKHTPIVQDIPGLFCNLIRQRGCAIFSNEASLASDDEM
jgi:hypothetical protein